jgi:ABC-type multidrug transport system fused ATPase/permease subunit
MWLAHPLASLGLLVLMLAGNARTGLYVLAMGGLVDALAAGAGAGAGPAAHYWVGVYIRASELEEVYWAAEPVLSVYLVDHSAYRIQRRVLERAAAAPLIQFEEGEFFDHLQRAAGGMGERLVNLSRSLIAQLRYPINLVSLALALGAVHPLLLPLLAIGSVPSVWLNARAANAVYRAQRLHTTRDRIRTHLQQLLTSRDAAAEVRLFGTAGYLLDRWRWLRDARRRDVLAAQGRRAALNTTGSLIAGVAYAAGLVLVTQLIVGGRISIGSYVTVATGALWFQEILGRLITSLRSLEEESQFLGDLFDFWRVARIEHDATDAPLVPGRSPNADAPDAATAAAVLPLSPRWERGPGGEGETTGAPTKRRGVALAAEGLTFAYPGAARPVLRDVDLRIAPGERVALVGANGAGKTTLVKLLLGLYQPDAGTVLVDGAPLTPERAAQQRRRFAAVFQDYASFQLTVRENVGFGDLARLRDDGALRRACAQAGIDGVVAALPKGLDTTLGR